jgi:hypothetical protein
MTAAAYKSSILDLLEDIDDEQTLGEAYLAIQEILHPEEFEPIDAIDFEEEVTSRHQSALRGETISHTEMGDWIANLTKS